MVDCKYLTNGFELRVEILRVCSAPNPERACQFLVSNPTGATKYKIAKVDLTFFLEFLGCRSMSVSNTLEKLLIGGQANGGGRTQIFGGGCKNKNSFEKFHAKTLRQSTYDLVKMIVIKFGGSVSHFTMISILLTDFLYLPCSKNI